MNNKLGKKVKELRLKEDLSQEKLEDILGYKHKSMISKIEKGQSEMSYEKLILLIKSYKLDPIDFIDDNKYDVQEISNVSNKANPDIIYPLKSKLNSVTYIKPTIKNKNIIVGDFSYYAGENFEKCVTHHYDFLKDKLIIGKFCQIGKDVEFVMNGANHQMNSVSTFPFYIFDGWEEEAPSIENLGNRGDTIIGNDVWIGEGVTIMPGVHIGNGAIIGKKAVVAKDIPSYSIVVGNPCKIIRKRFDDEMIELLEKLQWWNKEIDEIQKLIPLLTNDNLDFVKGEIKKQIEL